MKELDIHNHSHLSEEILSPNANKTDCNRLTMFDQHIVQADTLKYAEPPLVYTNFENQVGEASNMGYKKSDDDYEVIDKIYRNQYNFILILKSKTTGKYHFYERNEAKWLTEHYGFQWNNDKIDNYKKGDVINKEEVIYKNSLYDEDMNFGPGVNLNSVYLTYKNLTLEDAIVISEDGRDKLTTYTVTPIKINVNSNDILLNLYGDDKLYKCFPDIGEPIVNKTLATRRRISYDKMLYELKNLNQIEDDDTSFYGDGKIIDIKIYNNIPIEEMANQEYNNQALKYVTNNIKFCMNVVEKIEPVILSKEKNYTDELLSLYNDCKMQLDPNIKYSSENSVFNGFIIEFLVMQELPLNIGSKLTGRLTFKPSLQMAVMSF